jgi:5-methylcytosine-specific restriction endonuclease McrA
LSWHIDAMPKAADTYPDSIELIIRSRLAGYEETAERIVTDIAFEPRPRTRGPWPTRSVISAVYTRDRYQCRYCGQKVILTPVMRLISRLYPRRFPYNRNWRVSDTHPAFAARAATLDHVKPVAHHSGPFGEEELATACWSCNMRKGDLPLEALGWRLLDAADESWMGLTELFEPLWRAVGRPALGADELAWLRLIQRQAAR